MSNGVNVIIQPTTLVVKATKVEKVKSTERGPPGPPGAGGNVFEYSPPSASDEWIVNHNFGYNPVVAVLSPGGVEVEAQVLHTSLNQTRVLFNAPQLGKAIAR